MGEDEHRAASPPPTPTIGEYRRRYETHRTIPAEGLPRDQVLAEIREQAALERDRWEDGFVSGAVYHGDPEHIAFLNEVYAAGSQLNPLHTDLWPSAVKYESEIVAMTASMLHGEAVGAPPGTPDGVAGTVSSGGSESIQLAMKTYRDHARATKGITEPEMVCPVTAHAAFNKAARYFGITMVPVPVDEDGKAIVGAVADAITANTVVVVGSAPSFPYGTVDPIAEMSELARSHDIGFHTDACLGGYVLPWAEELGYDVPTFDFRLPGVTSISCDTHKYGYAAKGTSVVVYRSIALRHFQYFTLTDWPGGLYCSPTFAGSRPGGLSAACWAALVSIGADGYRRATRAIVETAAAMRAAITEQVPELSLIGDSLFVVAVRSDDDELDIYRVNDAMTERGWALNGLHRPPALHVAVTQRHTQPGVVERFVADLRSAIVEVRATPASGHGMAPVYGMANSVSDRSLVADGMNDFMDSWYRID